jgi:hypothetical protein
MAATLRYFLLAGDEVALFRELSRRGLTMYPELIPPGYSAPLADERVLSSLTERAYYLAAERLGPVIVRAKRKGPDKGMLAIDEIPSPVLHYERSLRNDAGELEAGCLWAELDVTDDPGSRLGKHRGLRALFEETHTWFRKTCLRSDPKGWWVGPAAARAWRSEGLVLREARYKGRAFGVWR